MAMNNCDLIAEFRRWWALSYATKPASHTEMVCVAFADHIQRQAAQLRQRQEVPRS
jgi:hypothetical protein